MTVLTRVLGGKISLFRFVLVADASKGFGTATDFFCVLVPLLVLRGLQLNKRKKIAMMAVFALGLL